MSLWKKLLWCAVTLLGLGAVCVLALSRGEQISALWIIVAGLCATSISYRFYSSWLATKVLVLNEGRATPAVLQNDSKDYVPTNRWMVCSDRWSGTAGRPSTGSTVWFSAGHALDLDWRNARRRRPRHDRAFRLNSAWRQNTRTNGEGRDRPRGWRARAHQC